MTVNTTTNRWAYVGNGVTTAFAVSGVFLASADLKVYQNGTLKTLTTHYAVTGGSGAVGTVTFVTAPANGDSIVIVRDPAITQSTDLINGDPLPAESVEQMSDRLTMVAQRLSNRMDYALRLTDAVLTPPAGLDQSVATRAGRLLGFDGLGDLTTFDEGVGGSTAAGISFTQSGSSVSRTLAAKLSEIVSPEDFGAEGDGVTDDTIPMNLLIAAVNGGVKIVTMPHGRTYLCGPLDTITADDVLFTGRGTIKAKGDSWSLVGDGSTHVNFNGARARVEGITFDGNQAAFTVNPGTGRMLASGNAPTMIGVTVKNSPYVGGRFIDTVEGTFEGCHFDDNVNIGAEFIAASYVDLAQSTFNRNGYGFHGSRANPAATTEASTIAGAFGFVLRLRCHHFKLVACQARDNGKDGFCTNQGSYAITYANCLSYANDDGGFTVASDNGGSGLPGEAESCYDLQFLGCESYNNWGSGLASYSGVHGVTVLGGRYYNNHRLAGDLVQASSYFNGLYFAAGSTGLNINTKAYDDRQRRVITLVAGAGLTRTLTATNWASGTKDYYPKVAIYTAAGVFRGFGRITAEAAGSVTIQTTVNNGVNLAAIVATDYVTQCVQLNGCFADNNTQGRATIDGFGHAQGPSGDIQGRNLIGGFNSNGLNVVLPHAKKNYTELLVNATFDVDVATGWTYNTPGGGAANYYTTNNSNRRSPGSLQLVAAAGNLAEGDSTLITDALKYMDDGWVEFTAEAKCSVVEGAFAQLFWTVGGNTYGSIVWHPGDGRWSALCVGVYIPVGATAVFARVGCGTLAAGCTAYFDNMSLRAVEEFIDTREDQPTSRYLSV